MAKAKADKPAGKKVPVIALESFEGHSYGHEFLLSEGTELDRLVKEGKVRIDDRMSPRPTETEPAAESE